MTVKGPKGTLERVLPAEMDHRRARTVDDHCNQTKRFKENEIFTWSDKNSDQQHGSVGVTAGYEKALEVNGVGYRACQAGKETDIKPWIFSSGRDGAIRKALETVVDGQNKIIVKGIR